MKIKKSIPLLLIVFLTSIHVDLLASDKGTYVSIENTETSENVNKTDENDPRAVAIANKVMDAMGGTKAWNNARHLHWNFFGARTLVWDKWTGDVRIDVPAEKATYLLNINTM
ncbi:MAG: hypothetical protein QMB24_14115, partial [Spirosomataceae bacterium]